MSPIPKALTAARRQRRRQPIAPIAAFRYWLGVRMRILNPAMMIESPGLGQSKASPETNGSMAGAMSRTILTVMAAMASSSARSCSSANARGSPAKAGGKYKGQSPHARKAPQVIELTAAGRTRAEIAAAVEISERSVYRILAETRPKTT